MRNAALLCSSSANSGAKSVTGTSSAIVPANDGGDRARKVLIITNCDSSAVIYVGLGFTPTTSDFTYKIAAASTIHLDMCQFTEALNAISSTGTVTVRVYEGV